MNSASASETAVPLFFVVAAVVAVVAVAVVVAAVVTGVVAVVVVTVVCVPLSVLPQAAKIMTAMHITHRIDSVARFSFFMFDTSQNRKYKNGSSNPRYIQ